MNLASIHSRRQELTYTAGDFPLLSVFLLGAGTPDELGLLFILFVLFGISSMFRTLHSLSILREKYLQKHHNIFY